MKFYPTEKTRLYMSLSSITKAHNILVHKRTCLNTYDKYAQLRQVRSDFTIPTTYRLARCSSKFADNIFSRPYTLFTAFTMETGDRMSDLQLGSSLFRLIASCVFENKRSITNEDVQAVAVVKDTCVSNAIQEIINLFSSDQTEIAIFGNQDLERILMEIAERLTPRLKEANKKVAKIIKESAQ